MKLIKSPTIKDAVFAMLEEHHLDTGWTCSGKIESFVDLSGVTLESGDDLKFVWGDVEAKKIELEAEWNAQKYARDRKSAYPAWGDQLDQIYHEGIDAWKASVKKIKDDNPKP